MMFADALTVAGVPDNCIDFEDLSPAATYSVGDTFVADNSGLQAKITGEPFTWSNGDVTALGQVQVDHSNLANHVGQELAVNNILLNFDFGGNVPNTRLHFGEYGGNLNLEINGDLHNFEDFQQVNGAVIGGTTVSVPVGGSGQDAGVLEIAGTIQSLKVGGQELWIDHVCVAQRAAVRYDWGDAPDKPYPTLAVNNGAHHWIDPKVHLGRRVEPEADGQPTLASDGDDVISAPSIDDEDGVQFITPLIPGEPATVEVIASTEGWLNAWMDFDRNGTWSSPASDNIFSGELLHPGVNVLTFMVPADAVPSPTRPVYSRWRFSTTDKVLRPEQPDNVVPNGEVEDHLTFIRERESDDRLDFGDAPDRPYPTLLSHDGARHRINPDVYLGKRIDSDTDGQPTFTAIGDDYDGNDDEDGVHFLTPVIPGHDAKVEVIASIDGFLDAWIDFDQDGHWAPHEQIAVSELVVVGSNIIDFVVPDDAIPHRTRPTYSRFRFSMDGGLQPNGYARDGEVEDYMILNGDLNEDGQITTLDIDLLCNAIHNGDTHGDVNGDGAIDDGDMDYLIHEILGTDYGDANLDGVFNSADLVQIFSTGEYEDGVPHNSGWADGDFDCDGEFTSSDIIKAMQTGSYSPAALPASSAVAAVAAVDSIFEYYKPTTKRTMQDEAIAESGVWI
jgi:hypothetical protein